MTFLSILVDATQWQPDEVSETLDSISQQDLGGIEIIVVTRTKTTGFQTKISVGKSAVRVTTIVDDSLDARAGDGWIRGLEAATGIYVMLIRAGDRLKEGGLRVVERAIVAHGLQSASQVDVLYGDDVDWSEGGKAHIRRKPAWSPELLRSRDYIGIAAIFRTELIRTGVDVLDLDLQCGLYDLTLRITEVADVVIHVPNTLLKIGSQTAQAMARGGNDVLFVQQHCDRIGIDAKVEALAGVGVQRVRRRWNTFPRVSIIIPTRGKELTAWGERRPAIIHCLRSIVEHTTWPNLEFVIVADEATDEHVINSLREITELPMTVITYREAFNFSRKINLGAMSATGEYFVLLNDDTVVKEPSWVQDLLGPLREDDVGMTGAKLLYSDSTIQHGGQFWCEDPGHLLVGLQSHKAGYLDSARISRECSGVTAACAAVRRDVFFSIGGMTELLPVNFNDVDFSLKIRAKGLRIVWVADACLWHFESSTREPSVDPSELEFLRRRWGTQLVSDPYLVLENLQPSSRPHFGLKHKVSAWR